MCFLQLPETSTSIRMSSPGGASSGTDKPDLFEDLLKQLGETHRNSLQELEAKVSKLKKDRCLDAQSLEVFYLRNQQLKEQNKSLQDTISLLEERLRAGECDRCAVLEEKLKSHQDQNLQVVTKLKNKRNVLQDENRKLQAQLQKLKTSQRESERTSSPEQEEGVIPDSPLMTSSLPAANKLKKRKHGDKTQRVRYAEMPLQQRGGSLLHAPAGGAERPAKVEVLVPDTCELDPSQISSEVDEGTEEAIAETCGLELLGNHPNRTEVAPSQQSSTWKHKVRLSPDSTSEKSPSLLRVKRFSEEACVGSAKRKKEDSEAQEGVDAGEHVNAPSVRQQSLKEHVESKDESVPDQGSPHKSHVSCKSPAFKKPQRKTKRGADVQRPEQELNAALQRPEATEAKRSTVEPAWSMDPALALSEGDEEMEERRHEDVADTDCTWVSHSMLQRGRRDSQDRGDGKTGLAEKANDSLDMMFDTTAYGTYKSYNGSRLDQSRPGDEAGEEEEEEEEEEELREADPAETAARLVKPGQPTFKYAAVIRKKDERRKLKGTTCMECEDYYSHLPDEEKQKKLAACSRHRFLYVPPSTPENFWEVGFPSTQTCIERGYIKEEKKPQARLRRRQPFNALFSQKQND